MKRRTLGHSPCQSPTPALATSNSPQRERERPRRRRPTRHVAAPRAPPPSPTRRLLSARRRRLHGCSTRLEGRTHQGPEPLGQCGSGRAGGRSPRAEVFRGGGHRRTLVLLCYQLMDMSGPRWKKGKDGKDFSALAAPNPMSSIVAELQVALGRSKFVATLSGRGGDAILGVKPDQAVLLNRAAFGRAVENAGADKQWFQLGPEELFYLCHALKCIAVETENKNQMSEGELWDHLSSTSESFPEMYKAYSHLRLKNWVVRSGLQYGADFVAYCHHPALVHSEFAVVVVPEGEEFGSRCGRLKVWSDLLCALRASGSVAKTLLVLTVSSSSCDLSSPGCLEQLVVHERTITRWIPRQCREQRGEPCREEANTEEQDHKRESVVFNYWGVILGFTLLSSLLVYKLKF